MKKNVAILFGGDSTEYEISMKSGQQVFKWVNTAKYNPFLIHVKKSKWVVYSPTGKGKQVNKDDFSISLKNEHIRFDFALIMIHGTPGENGILQSYFDILNIPYSTCSAFTSMLTFNKWATKVFLEKAVPNFKSARAVLIRKNDKPDVEKIIEELGLPIFVKPNNGGSSYGVTKVKTAKALLPAIEKALSVDHEAILEEFIAGTEITNGVFKTDKKEIIFPITEIVPQTEYFDVDAKYKGKSDEITPARIDKDVEAKCKKLSSKIYDSLGCYGITRIDYIISGNILNFLEINTVPGMTEQSIIPQQAAVYGVTMTKLFDMVIDDAFARKNR